MESTSSTPTSKRKTTKKSKQERSKKKSSSRSQVQGDPDGLEGRDVVESILEVVGGNDAVSRTSIRKTKKKKTKKEKQQQQQQQQDASTLPSSNHQMETIPEQHQQQRPSSSFQQQQQQQQQEQFLPLPQKLQPLPENLQKPPTVSTSRNTSTSTTVSFNLGNLNQSQDSSERTDDSGSGTCKEHFYRPSHACNNPGGGIDDDGNATTSIMTPNVFVVDTEERQLFTDTFSFLMTARYPCEKEGKRVLNHIENGAIHMVHTLDEHGRKAMEGGKQIIENTRTTIANNNILLRPNYTQQKQQQQQQQRRSDSIMLPRAMYSIQGGQLYSTRSSILTTTPSNHMNNNNNNNNNNDVSGVLFHDGSKFMSSDDDDNNDNNRNEIFSDELFVVSPTNNNNYDESEIFTISTPQLSENAKKLLKVNADYMYLPFICGWLILLLQVFIYFVVFVNVLQTNGEPPNADAWLRSAQWFALMVSLYTQSDLVDAVFMLTEGSYRFESITTTFKFNLSNAMRFGSGNLGLMASFVLVIYAEDIVDLLLNFTAIEFVSLLDNHAFNLASKGFLGINIEKKAKQIEQFRYEQLVRKSSSMKRLLVYIFYFLVYAGVFLWLFLLQKSRKIGVENQIYVQFDDTDVPELFGISGAYIGCSNYRTFRNGQLYTNNIGYVDASWHGDCPELVYDEGVDNLDWIFPANAFYFCTEFDGWVYIKNETRDPCDQSGYILRSFSEDSSPADWFDILKHDEADWFVQQPETQALVLVDSVFMNPVNPRNLFGIQYNCTTGLQAILNLETSGTSMRSFSSLPYSYYPIFEADFDNFEEDMNYFDKFSLVYRQVFFGDRSQNDGSIVEGTVVLPDCNSPESFDDRWNLVMFDGLRWHAMIDFDIKRFVEYFKAKYADAAAEPDSLCGWKFFLRYYLREMSWMFNDAIATPFFISEPMLFLKPVDTGGPTINLEWFQADLIYNEEIIKPGISTYETGTDLEASCSIQEEQCSKSEIFFSVQVKTQRFPEETAVLILRQPSLQGIAINDYMEVQDLLGDRIDLYADAETIPIAKDRSVFSISASEVKDFRFRDRETAYHLETCVPVVEGFTFCMDVTVLNRNPSREGSRLAEFNLGFGDNARRSREVHTLSSNCTRYQVCYFEAEPGVFLGDFWGPEECSYSEIEAEYPGIATQVTFEDTST